ncbi:5-hydroxytryptamine receptor 1 isoform X2 [Procambarus clarkii]|uniref:5-hydroxytryptamine receptor 1 isoform X2 n=1 Tax=Procambarus clarkii TaxID=6728 RepID=UPI0037420DF3
MLASVGVARPTPSLHQFLNISHAANLILEPSVAAHTPLAGVHGPMVGTDSGLVTVDPVNITELDGGGVKTGESSLHGLFTTALLVLVLLMIIVGTVVGNLLVCVAVCLVRKLRRPYNYLLVSLAVSDLCVALLVMPMALLHELLGEWQFGRLACDVWVSFDVLSCTASILNLCMISVDRYLAITRPLEYGVKRTPRRMVAYIAFVWLGAAFISVPPILILGNEHGDGSICEVCQNFWYQIYATFGSFYIPLTVMVTVYYKIFCAAKRIVNEERKAQAHLRLVEATEADARASSGSYTQLKPVSRYSVVEVNNGGVETRLAPDAPTLCSRGETGSLLGPESPHHLEVPPRLVVCSSSVSSAASADSTTGSRWSLCETNGKAHPPTSPRTPTQQPTHAHNCYNACQSTNGSGDPNSPRKRIQPPKTKLKFALAKERKASTTLGIIMSAFVVCWLPFFVLALVRPFKTPSSIPAWISSLFLWLGYANSLLNPIIYATLNKDFRKPFQVLTRNIEHTNSLTSYQHSLEILCLRCASLNLLMREEFYHSQYGGPDTPTLSAVRTHTHTNPRNSSEIHLTINEPREPSVSEEARESRI